MNNYKILIVEDDPIIAEDIKECLEEENFEVSGIAYEGKAAVNAIEQTPPDLILLDIQLSHRMNGIELAHLINKKYKLPFIFLTSYADRATIQQVKQTFPMGYLVKPFGSKDLLTAIEIALVNFHQLKPKEERTLSLAFINKRVFTPLTERELEVLKLLVKGNTNKQIAEALFVSTNTVKTHLSNIYNKLDVDSRAKVLAFVSKILTKAS